MAAKHTNTSAGDEHGEETGCSLPSMHLDLGAIGR
jgi:hypothetical protein